MKPKNKVLTTHESQPKSAHEPTGVIPSQDSAAQVQLVPTLNELDRRYLAERELLVTEGIKSSIAAAKALCEICNHANGKLWKATHDTFAAYCKAKWNYEKAHAYRLVSSGEVIKLLEIKNGTKKSPNGDWLPVSESHLRPLLKLSKYKRPDCWLGIVAKHKPAELTEKIVAAETAVFAESIGAPITSRKAEPPSPFEHANACCMKFRAAAMHLPDAAKIIEILSQLDPYLVSPATSASTNHN